VYRVVIMKKDVHKKGKLSDTPFPSHLAPETPNSQFQTLSVKQWERDEL